VIGDSDRMSLLSDTDTRVMSSWSCRVLLLLLLGLATGSSRKMTGSFDSSSVRGDLIFDLTSQHPDIKIISNWNVTFLEAPIQEDGSPGSLTAILVIPEICTKAKEIATTGASALTYIVNPEGVFTKDSFGIDIEKFVIESLFTSENATSVVIVKCAAGEICESVEEVIDCAELVTEDDGLGLSTEIIIIIIVAGIILLLIIICVPIICCCIQRRRHTREKGDKIEVDVGDGDSVDDPFLMNGKQSKSEISIPYMDASLPPTPKGGRSGFRLEDLLGNNNRLSTSSISEKPM